MEESMLYPQTTADLVYQHLRRQIFSKKRLPGERLPEVLIARELNVSRTPVREALRRLTNEGLVDLIPNVGAVSPRLQNKRFSTHMRYENILNV